MENQKKETNTKAPMIKWLTIGCLGSILIPVLGILILVWRFTPMMSVTDGKVRLFGGAISIDEDSDMETFSQGFIDTQRSMASEPLTEIKMFPTKDIKLVKIENGAGNITLTESKDLLQAKIQADKIDWSNDCELEMNQTNEILFLSAKSVTSNAKCKLNFHASIPTPISLDITSGSGDVSISNLAGNFKIKIGSGDLKIEHTILESLEYQSGSGDIRLTGELKNLDLNLGSGDAYINFEKVPSLGKLSLKTGSGDVRIQLPEASKISQDLETGSGNFKSDFANMANDSYVISVKSGSGEVRIKKF